MLSYWFNTIQATGNQAELFSGDNGSCSAYTDREPVQRSDEVFTPRLTKLLTTTLFVCLTFPALARGTSIHQDSLKRHIYVLASDSLEGREVGEQGELKAARYIEQQFSNIGLQPKGTDKFRQSFVFTKKVTYGKKNTLSINGTSLQLEADFIPLQQSGSLSFHFKEIVDVGFGIITPDSSVNDYKGQSVAGKAVLVRRFRPDSSANPHLDLDAYSAMSDKIAFAESRQAAAIFFITPSDHDDTLPTQNISKLTARSIPVVYIRQSALTKLGLSLDAPAIRSIKGQTELIAAKDTGWNVLALQPGQSDTVVIIGAHYDHLGYGTHGSRYLGKEKLIHYGADDNASGTAGLIELAKLAAVQAQNGELHYSYLFAAFSGEESGLLGSNHFVKQMTIDSGKVRYMLNMDMIGRLKDQESGLAVFGVGTAASFKSYFDSLTRTDIKMVFKEPGTGPSDHTAFYHAGIPVLHFFTGAHEDYHKPSDTPEKIDYDGTAVVLDVIWNTMRQFDQPSIGLAYQRTKDENAPRMQSGFNVTLGIMPDYVAEVKGLRIDGVSPDRPAERAGLLRGDIIIQLGEYVIEDIGGYMSALRKFRKGDESVVRAVRGSDTLSLPVAFR